MARAEPFVVVREVPTTFINNLVPGSHWTPITPKNVKIRLSRNLMKFVWVTRSRKTNPIVSSVSSFEIWRIFMFSTYTILAIYHFAIFQKNSIFLGFYSFYFFHFPIFISISIHFTKFCTIFSKWSCYCYATNFPKSLSS